MTQHLGKRYLKRSNAVFLKGCFKKNISVEGESTCFNHLAAQV